MRGCPRGIGRRNESLFRRKFKGQRHSQRHRLAVQQPVGKAAAGFERMTEGVAEIEQRTLAGFALVARNDAGLATATHRNGVLACGTAGKDILPVLLQPGEERGIAEQPVFGNFGIACAEFPFRQRVEQCRICNDQNRLMERADEILALARIDSGLAADRRVDLRKQCRRHLHEIETAPGACSREPCKIADHAAAKRYDEIVAFDTRGDDRLAYLFEGRIAL